VSRDGLAVVDKPAGITSHDVVSRVRRITDTRKVGHAGTLDPMATGVLVLGVGRATRLLTYLVGVDKGYRATIRLGAATLTDDIEGEVLMRADASGVTEEAVRCGVSALTGAIQQVPSAVSAIKVDGKRAYARVRAGEEVTLAARPVTVSRFDISAVRRGIVEGSAVVDLDVDVECSSGTYIRALARDLGDGLGVGGHLTSLRRTRVGPYPESVARTLEDLAADRALMSVQEAARAAFPARELTQDEADRLAHGQRIGKSGTGEVPTAAFAPDGALVAIVSETGPTCRALLVMQG
jgi:tRNA pseudouridine55 synthase